MVEAFTVQQRGQQLQQCTVEHTEQVGAHRTAWSSTVSISIYSCLDLVMPLDFGSLGQESEVDVNQLFFTLNKVTAHVIYHPSSHHPQVLW